MKTKMVSRKCYALLLVCGLLLSSLFIAPKASAASDKEIMEQALENYRQGNFAEVNRYGDMLSAKAHEKCVKNMSKKMKKAYRKVVKRYMKKYPYRIGIRDGMFMQGYYLTDIDNDKKAELIIRVDAGVSIGWRVYDYKDGKAVKIGSDWVQAQDSHTYPGHKGVVCLWGRQGAETVSIYKIKKGKLVQEVVGDYGRIETVDDFVHIGLELDDHYSWNNGSRFSLKDLK